MNETLNLEQYLYLKQQLVMFDAAMHQAEIVIDGVGVNREILAKGIRQSVTQIYEDLTPPVALLELRPTNVNLTDLSNVIINHLCKDVGVNQPATEVYELVNVYPKLHQLEKELLGIGNKTVQPRTAVTTLIDSVDRLCAYIAEWVGEPLESRKATLKDVLVGVNHLQVIDTIFEYTNETFGA